MSEERGDCQCFLECGFADDTLHYLSDNGAESLKDSCTFCGGRMKILRQMKSKTLGWVGAPLWQRLPTMSVFPQWFIE